MTTTTATSPATPSSFRATVAECGLGAKSAPEDDVAASLSALAAQWAVTFPPRPAAMAARLIAPLQHPTHALLQSWLTESLSPDTEARLGALAQATVGARLELIALRGRASFDLVQEISEPLWPDLLAAWSGLADQQRRRLHHLRRTLEVLSDPGQLSPRRLASVASALDELRRMFADAYRYPRYIRAVPSLFTALETGWTPAHGLIEDEVVFAATQLLLVGSEANASLTCPLVEMLMRRPRQLARLRANPAYVVTFVDEREAAFARHRSKLQQGQPGSAPPFERLSQLLARMQAVAVIKALLCAPTAIGAYDKGTAWKVHIDHTRRLDHLDLQFDVYR